MTAPEQGERIGVSETTPAHVAGLRQCPMCGATVSVHAPSCPDCGEFLAGGSREGYWREGNLLVMGRSATLPMRCLKTNAATDLQEWTHGAARRPVTVRYARSRCWARRFAMLSGLTITVFGTGAILLGGLTWYMSSGSHSAERESFVGIAAGLVFMIGVAVMFGAWPLCDVDVIDDGRVEIFGVHRDFLARLPDLGPAANRRPGDEHPDIVDSSNR